MSVKIRVPALWRDTTQGANYIEVEPGKLEEVLRAMIARTPALAGFLLNANQEVNPNILFYINQESIRLRQGLQSPVQDGDEVYIIPMLSGGSE